MEKTVPLDLDIGFSPETLDDGSAEERAGFGKFTIETRNVLLTEGFDHHIQGRRTGPLVSAYFAAEWFAWNWWRLRWEPRGHGSDWDFAHRMNSIGEGYVWPNIAIWSDGVRTTLVSAPSRNPEAKPFRYFGALPVIVPSGFFETALDNFIGQVLGRLHDSGIRNSNLEKLWADVLAERNDPAIALRRRLEAMLGREPDEMDDDRVEQLVIDVARLGEQAVEEIAADQGLAGSAAAYAIRADDFIETAQAYGVEVVLSDTVNLDSAALVKHEIPIAAWQLGAEAAQALRKQEKLGAAPISNKRLAQMAGTSTSAVNSSKKITAPMSFLLSVEHEVPRIVIDAPREEGRRFNLARILGDGLLNPVDPLRPATRAYTYRQQAQRAFAAELLSPIAIVQEMLCGDYSTEKQQVVSKYFDVSDWTISTMLTNYRLIGRDDSEQYAEAFVA